YRYPEADARAVPRARVDRELRSDEARRLAHLKKSQTAARGVAPEDGADVEALSIVLDDRDHGVGLVVHVDVHVRRAAGLERVVRRLTDHGEGASLDLRSQAPRALGSAHGHVAAVGAVDPLGERTDRRGEAALLEGQRAQREQDVPQTLLRVDEPLAKRAEIGEGRLDVEPRALARDLDADRGVRQRLRDAVVEIPGETLPLLLRYVYDAQPLRREIGRELNVFEGDARGAGQRLHELLVLGHEQTVVLVQHLQHAQAAPVARLDRCDEDGSCP